MVLILVQICCSIMQNFKANCTSEKMIWSGTERVLVEAIETHCKINHWTYY